MDTIIITPRTAYFVDNVELWDTRRIAVEYGISKATIRKMIADGVFPNPYASSEGGKTFYVAKEILSWAENTDTMKATIEKKSRRVGRPVTTNRDVSLIKATKH